MKIDRENLEKKLGITDERILDIVDEFRSLLPILTEECGDFCVDGRELHKQLVINDTSKKSKGTEFPKWIDRRIKSYYFEENVDYEVYFRVPKNDEVKNDDVNLTQDDIAKMNTNQRSRRGITTEYRLTMNMAKELSMIENNEIGKKARKYFITIEKILKLALEWEEIREPEKKRYNKMKKEIDDYYARNKDEAPSEFVYIAEAEFINQLVLGAKSEEIRMFIKAQDDNTRDWVTSVHNEAIDYIQEQNITFLRMDMDKDSRRNLLTRMFEVKYPNLKPVVTGEELEKIKYRIKMRKNFDKFARQLFG